MLSPNTDRLDYGRLLAPPPGYHLDFTVGATYSLDLDALVGAALALALGEETDSALLENPVCLLEALRGTGDRAALFCEDGQIALPGRATSLYILLEKMVCPVRVEKGSFHPKLWLLRYRSEQGNCLYRLVVLSRNLTFDRSWDVAFSMEGEQGKTSGRKNEPLRDFLRYLAKQLPDTPAGRAKRENINVIIKELPKILFSTGEKAFSDFDFYPTGIPRHSIRSAPLFTEKFRELLVMSPFLSGGIIRDFNDRGKRCALFTRAESLAKLKPEDCSNFQLYTLRDGVIDGEAELSESPAQKQDIHPKLYLADRNLYLGSLNASHNAVYRNVEFMLRLHSSGHYLSMDKLLCALRGNDPGGSGDPFQETTLGGGSEEPEGNDLDAVVKALVRCSPRAAVMPVGERYDLRLTFDTLPDCPYSVTLRPLLAKGLEIPVGLGMVFPGLELTQLSEFYVLSVSDGSNFIHRLLLVTTEGMPEEREAAVVSGVVKDVGLVRYIAFLLGDNAILSTLEQSDIGEGKTGPRRREGLPSLYEKMLLAAATDREKLRNVDSLLHMMEGGETDEELEQFKALYDTFKKAVKLDG